MSKQVINSKPDSTPIFTNVTLKPNASNKSDPAKYETKFPMIIPWE